MDDKFPPEIYEDLGHYVYRLIDPRDGRTFYVGKGSKDRVFDHMRGVIPAKTHVTQGEDDEFPYNDKFSDHMRKISEILKEGLQPIHIIHRHGLNEADAYLAEAVLIDAIPGLSNEQGGHGSSSFGPCNASQLILRYKAPIAAVPTGLHVLAINVSRSTSEGKSTYAAVRGFWRIDVERASRADIILAVSGGICRGVYHADKWLPANSTNFPYLEESIPGRSGFIGREADEEYQSIFLNKRVPVEFSWKRGMATPIQYNYS